MKILFGAATLLSLLAVTMLAQCGPAKNVNPDEAAKMLSEKKDIAILDLRTGEEFKAGHIAGARNIDFLADDFAKKVGALDKSKSYLVHCGSGGRSTKALEVFASHKFTSIVHLNEGFKAWVASGKPVEK